MSLKFLFNISKVPLEMIHYEGFFDSLVLLVRSIDQKIADLAADRLTELSLSEMDALLINEKNILDIYDSIRDKSLVAWAISNHLCGKEELQMKIVTHQTF